MNSFFIYATAWVVFKTRNGGSRFIFKKMEIDPFKKLERKRRDSINMLGTAKMAQSTTNLKQRMTTRQNEATAR